MTHIERPPKRGACMGEKIRRVCKESSLLLLLLTTSMGAEAQDRIVTKDGEVVECWQVEVSGTDVLYKEWNAEDAPLRRMDKSFVLMIRRADGRKEMIVEREEATPQKVQQPVAQPQTNLAKQTPKEKPAEETATTPQNVQQQPVVQPQANFGEPDPERNEELKRSYCGDVRYVGKTSEKDAGRVVIVSRPMKGSTFANKDIEVKFSNCYYEKGKQPPPLYRFPKKITLTNRTDKVIYIDKANSFFRRSGRSFPFYVPTATSNTKVHTSGSSSYIGYGVSVGGATTLSTSTIVYSQRVESIPPHSSIDLAVVAPHEEYILYDAWTGAKVNKSKLKTSSLIVGQSIRLEERNSPNQWGTFLTYGFDENFTTTKSIQSDFYIAECIGIKKSISFVTDECSIDNDVIFECMKW